MVPRFDPKQTLDDFDPNKQDLYLAYAPARVGSRAFKLTLGRRGALTMFGGETYAALYRMGRNGWELEARKCREDHNGRCTRCGHPTILPSGAVAYGPYNNIPFGMVRLDGGMVDTGRFKYERDPAGRIASPVSLLFLCEACYGLMR